MNARKLFQKNTFKLSTAVLAIVVAGAVSAPFASAARGGKQATTSSTVTSSYGISGVGGTWGPSGVPSTITITDSLTGAPRASLDGVESLIVDLACYQKGAIVGWGEFSPISVTTSSSNYSLKWTSGAADCTLSLKVMRNWVWVETASTTYHVAA